MKTDRELLELAAKAAGIELKYNYLWRRDARQPWNPLTDDGDALRLAEFLGLTVCMDGIGTVSTCDQVRTDVFITQDIRECKSRIEATRRAITRAAAAIGESMP